MKFRNFLQFFGVIFALLDPDSDYGSADLIDYGSETLQARFVPASSPANCEIDREKVLDV
jgi:hypothetical protein